MVNYKDLGLVNTRDMCYLCALKMTITLFLTKIVTEYKLKKQILK